MNDSSSAKTFGQKVFDVLGFPYGDVAEKNKLGAYMPYNDFGSYMKRLFSYSQLPLYTVLSWFDMDPASRAEAEQKQNDLYSKINNDAIVAQQMENQINREFQQTSAREVNTFNANEAQKNRDWQEYMSNTAYQRAMADMRQAGLNPLLAFQQGGASFSGGSSAQGVAASGGGSALDTDNVMQLLQANMNQSAQTASAFMNAISLIGSVVLGKYLPIAKTASKIGFV